jgi:hypothetical protein
MAKHGHTRDKTLEQQRRSTGRREGGRRNGGWGWEGKQSRNVAVPWKLNTSRQVLGPFWMCLLASKAHCWEEEPVQGVTCPGSPLPADLSTHMPDPVFFMTPEVKLWQSERWGSRERGDRMDRQSRNAA